MRSIAIACALALALQPVQAQQLTSPRIPASVLERYVGEYVYPDGNTIFVRLRGDTLFREITGQRIAFVPLSETRFRLGPVFTAEFVLDPAGGATQYLSDGVDVEYRLRRKETGTAARIAMPAAPRAAATAAVRVPRSVLERYVGVYEYIPGQMKRTDLTVVVRLQGDTLMRSTGGQAEVLLTPMSETLFKVGNTTMVTEFVVDDWGVAQVLGIGFQQMLARLNPKR